MNVHLVDVWQAALLFLIAVPTCFLLFGIVKRRVPIIPTILRLGVLFLLWKAAVEPILSNVPHDAPILVMADISKSMSPDEVQELSAQASQLLETTTTTAASVITFAKFPNLPSPFTGRISPPTQMSEADLQKTDIEAALLTAFGSKPRGIILLTDGNETLGNALHAAQELSREGIPIYPLTPARQKKDKAPYISQLYSPLVAPVARSISIQTTITNPQESDTEVKLEIYQGQKKLFEKTVSLPRSQDVVVLTESDPSAEGLTEIRAILTWPIGSPQSSTSTSYMSGEKREKILLLSGSSEDDRFLTPALTSQAYQLNSLVANASLTTDLSSYSVVILNNALLNQLPSQMPQALEGFVKNGGGLVMSGGSRSFGLGGYIGSAIEEILPVKLLPPQSEKKRIDVAVQLVIDKSQSMGNDNKIEFAKEAAKQVVLNLQPEDFIGIIGFDQYPWVAVPIDKVFKVKAQALKQIDDLYPTRTTQLFSALSEAASQLQGIRAGRKHTIVLTDGKIPDANPYYETLIREMRGTGITVSTVLLGDPSHGEFLRRLANIGGGTYYQTQDPRSLPKIFLNDVNVMAGERTLKEAVEYSVKESAEGISSSELRQFPNLKGYVDTKAKAGAHLELTVTGLGNAEPPAPLLASWKQGSGHVVAYTSDTNGRWSSEWIPWNKFGAFWSDIVNAARGAKAEKKRPPPFDLQPFIARGTLYLDLFIYADVAGKIPIGRIQIPGKAEASEVAFSLLEVGHFRAHIEDPSAGTYNAKIKLDDVEFPEIAWTLKSEAIGEDPELVPNFSLLEQLATTTGGALNPTREQITFPERTTVPRYTFPRNVALLAFCLFLLELMWRILRVS